MQQENPLNKSWEKCSTFSLCIDYNIDKGCHAILTYMNQKGVLEEYLLSLVRNDLSATQSPFRTLDNCGIFALRCLGLSIDEEKWQMIREGVCSEERMVKLQEAKAERSKLLLEEAGHKQISLVSSTNNTPEGQSDTKDDQKTEENARRENAQKTGNSHQANSEALEQLGGILGGTVSIIEK